MLEEAERAIKTVIAEDKLLPVHCRDLSPEEWGIELADYFECVSGEHPARGRHSLVALPCSSATSAGAITYANTYCMISLCRCNILCMLTGDTLAAIFES